MSKNSGIDSQNLWGDASFLDLIVLDAVKNEKTAKRKLEDSPLVSKNDIVQNSPAVKKPKLRDYTRNKFKTPKSTTKKQKLRSPLLDTYFNDSFRIENIVESEFKIPEPKPTGNVKTVEAIPDADVLCSQRFIDEIQQLSKTEKTKCNIIPETDSKHIITKNEELCTQYIQLASNAKDKSLDEDTLDHVFIDPEDQLKVSLNENIDSLENSIVDLNSSDIKRIDWDDNDFSLTTTPVTSRAKSNTRIQTTPEAPSSILKNFFKYKNETPFAKLSRVKSQEKTPVMRPVSSSKFSNIGPFFGLPMKVKQLIKEYKGIDKLYDWQEECLNLKAIHQRNNLIYALPTSGGKSLVAEILMIREIMCRRKNVLLVLPYVSLVQEKITDLTPFALELGYLVEEYAAGKGQIPPIKKRNKNSIFISTIEKSVILFDSLVEVNRIGEIGLIVVDELHMVGDPQRGYILETLLSKSMFLLKSQVQIVGMSATISNLTEISTFLKADVYTKEFRPIELKEYVKYGKDLMEVKPDKSDIKEAFEFSRTLEFHYDQRTSQRDPDHLTALVEEVIPAEACLIFCPTKQNCENVAMLLSELLPKELKEHRKDEKIELMNAIRLDTGGNLCDVLTKTLPFGVAYHHSGLTAEERKHIEDAYRLGIISALCCTSTLAAGVNLPAKRVIIRSPYTGTEFLTLSRYKQMVGRAGRAGHASAGESILICGPHDNAKLAILFCSAMDEVVSGFISDKQRVLAQTIIMNCIENNVANNLRDLLKFFEMTLAGIQCDRFQVNMRDVVVRGLKTLFRNGALAIQKNETVPAGDDSSFIEITQNSQSKLRLNSLDHLTVNKLGKGAVKAGISLEQANELYKHLQTCQKSFDLSNYLHLLYLVTPNEVVMTIKPNYQIYHNIFMKLEPSLIHTASIIGVSELNAMQMITRPNFKGAKKLTIEKFYTTLILHDLWNLKEVHEVAVKYRVNRGIIQKLMFAAATNSSSILRFCEEMDEFWAFRELLEKFTKRLAYCCTSELLPLMELPGVKIGRAKLLYQAGFRTVEDIANATSRTLVENVKNISYKVAKGMIQAAKLSLVERIDMYQEKVQEMMRIVGTN